VDACHRALQLDPGVADGHANLGCLLGADWRWEEGEKSLLKAIALVDQCSTRWLYGMHLLMLRRWEEAWYSFSISAALDQLSPRRRIALERFRYYSGQFTQAPGEQLKIKRFEDSHGGASVQCTRRGTARGGGASVSYRELRS
jgi:hypothetical protein